jgi:predicted TIM-barrel fold metal-dependent hydrolase
MRIDVNASLGSYPWRRVPGTSAEALREAMDRVGIDRAWVFHLPGIAWRDPMEGNAWLLDCCARQPRFTPVPSIHPGLPGWSDELARMAASGVRVVRSDPTWYGIAAAGAEMRALVRETGQLGMALMMAVRFEDGRQRHPLDRAEEFPAAAVRALIREHGDARLIVTHADRTFIEEVHFGSTPGEAGRIWWDVSWVWGPPEDHLETLLETMGPSRFLLGSGQPLRLPETPLARLDLLDLSDDDRASIESGNALALLGQGK